MSLEAHSVVPSLAPGVQASAYAGQLELRDPRTNNTLVLRGFDPDLLWLFDGRHTAEQVLDAARQLAVQLTLNNLSNLVRRMLALGLVVLPPPAVDRRGRPLPPPQVAPVALGPEPSTEVEAPLPRPQAPPAAKKSRTGAWAPPQLWGPEIAAAFKEALKGARAEQYEQAKGQLQSVIERQPDLAEAHELLAWLDERLAGKGGKSFAEEFRHVETEWLREDEADAPRRGPYAFRDLLALALVLLLGAAVLAPLPYWVEAWWEVAPASVEPVLLELGGTVRWVVDENRWVEKGARLLELEGAPALLAPGEGYVRELAMQVGDEVEPSAQLCVLESREMVVSFVFPPGVRLDGAKQVTLPLEQGPLVLTFGAQRGNVALARDPSGRLASGSSGAVKVDLGRRSFFER